LSLKAKLGEKDHLNDLDSAKENHPNLVVQLL